MKKKLLTGLLATFALSCALGFASCELPFLQNGEQTEDVAPFAFELVGDSYMITGRGADDSGILEFPEEYNGKPVTAIGEGAFRNDLEIGQLIIPDSITMIGAGAFDGCVNLMSATIGSGVTSIPKEAFRKCTFLKTVEFSDTLVSIGESAFSYCERLLKIEMPNTVKTVSPKAFYQCVALKDVTFSSSLELIGESAFDKCLKLKQVVIPDGAPTVIEPYAFSITTNPTDDMRMSIEYVELGDSVVSIGKGAFKENSFIRELVLGESITSIGGGAFYKCRRMYTITVRGENVPACQTEEIINSDQDLVSASSFDGCYVVREILDCSGTLVAGSSAMGGLLESVWNVRTPNETSKVSYDETTGLIYYLGNDVPYSATRGTDCAVVIAALLDKFNENVDVVIPATYKGKPVLAIADKAFYNETSITSLDTGKCKYIGYQTCQNAYGITKLHLRESVTTIANNAFLNTISLADVYFHGTTVTSVGQKAFFKKKKTGGEIAGTQYKNVYFAGTAEQWEVLKNTIKGGYVDDQNTHGNDDLFAAKLTLNYNK